jgi:hypothetical protein
MANHHQPPPQPPTDDDFFEQFLSYSLPGDASTAGAASGGAPPPFPLALSLDQGAGEGSGIGKRIRDHPDKVLRSLASGVVKFRRTSPLRVNLFIALFALIPVVIFLF